MLGVTLLTMIVCDGEVKMVHSLVVTDVRIGTLVFKFESDSPA